MNMKKVYIVMFYCCRLNPQSIFGVYSTLKKAKTSAKNINGAWIETFQIDTEKKIFIERV